MGDLSDLDTGVSQLSVFVCPTLLPRRVGKRHQSDVYDDCGSYISHYRRRDTEVDRVAGIRKTNKLFAWDKSYFLILSFNDSC